jgi:periplasmic protein TonB
MQSNNILSAPLIDIIFDGRNKDYGAYELRKKYNQRIRKALFITGLVVTLTFGTVVLASTFKKNDPNYVIGPGMTIQSIQDEKPPEKLPEPEKPKPVEPEARTEQFTQLEIVEQPETPPPSQTELETAKIDTEKRDGKEDDGTVDPPPPDIDNGTGIIDIQPKEPEGPAERVDIDAKFDGNWKRFLETNLNADVPVHNSAPAGRYSVIIRFVVDVDGTISNIEPLTKHGYGLEEEGIRVIKKSKKWEPAFLNGTHIKAYKRQVITFDVLEE